MQKKNIYPIVIKDSDEITALQNCVEELQWFVMLFLKSKLTLKSEQKHIPKSGRGINYMTL